MVDFSQFGRRLTAALAAAAGFFAVAAAAAPFGGAFGGAEKPAVTAEIVADRTAGTPKAVYKIGVLLKHAPGWHTYWKFPGDSGYMHAGGKRRQGSTASCKAVSRFE